MKNRICRICWNTNGWTRPSGAIKKEKERSWAKDHGFGLEEWLFNYEWSINGYKYGYLQAIRNYRKNHEGESFSVLLYTKHKAYTLLVATISNVYIPKMDELKKAFKKMTSRGWVNQMRKDIQGVTDRKLADEVKKNLYQKQGWSPDWLINIRFSPSDVMQFDPMKLDDDRIKGYYYTTLYNWENDQILPALDDQENMHDPDVRMRSGIQSIRAAQSATTIDHQHNRMQKRLFYALKKTYPRAKILYEKYHVDLQVVDADGCIFYEIKTDSNAKRCIRNALGQLLEYSSYPAEKKARKLVVVGNAPVTEDDRSYLEHLRETYSLPIYYARFNGETEDLEKEV